MRYLLLALTAVLISCTAKKEDEKLNKAMDIHNEAIAMSKVVKKKLEGIVLQHYPSDTTQYGQSYDALVVLQEDHVFWESNLVEVPGQEHDHHHHDHEHHDLDHSHEAPADLTPAMVLEIQEDLLKQISLIDKRADELLENLESSEK